MLKLIDPVSARNLVLDNISSLKPVPIPVSRSYGKILAEAVSADRDYPPFNRAMMDGFAVRFSDLGKELRVTGPIKAGLPTELEIRGGVAGEIMTGAPCPEGTELVAQYEICEQQGDRVRLPNIPSNGTNIALRGSECTKGATILSEGQEISGLCTAVLSTFGRTEVSVHPNPTISIVVTGDEVEKIAGPCEDTSIRDSNGPMLRAMALNLGVEEIRTIRVGDTACKLVSALEKASEADLVLVTGGVSAGKFDLVPESLRTLGVELIFHKVTQKPGKPFLFGLKNGQPFFGLPGNPLACHLCFHRYIVPSILKMSGKPPRLSSGHGNLTGKVRGTGSRTRFQLVQLSEDYSTNGLPNVTPLIGRGSADIFAPVSADAYIRVPPRIAQVDKGDVVEYELIGA